MIDEKMLQEAEELTAEFLETMGVQAKVDAVMDDEPQEFIEIVVEGEDLSDLIGFHGRTLDSLQYLINLSFNKNREEHIKIIIDVNQYRVQREEYLRSVADKALVNVRESRQPMVLQPMKPAERRIIHLALKGETGITTTSEGEEPNRYIIIKPD